MPQIASVTTIDYDPPADAWQFVCPACGIGGTAIMPRNCMPTFCPHCGETADYDQQLVEPVYRVEMHYLSFSPRIGG